MGRDGFFWVTQPGHHNSSLTLSPAQPELRPRLFLAICILKTGQERKRLTSDVPRHFPVSASSASQTAVKRPLCTGLFDPTRSAHSVRPDPEVQLRACGFHSRPPSLFLKSNSGLFCSCPHLDLAHYSKCVWAKPGLCVNANSTTATSGKWGNLKPLQPVEDRSSRRYITASRQILKITKKATLEVGRMSGSNDALQESVICQNLWSNVMQILFFSPLAPRSDLPASVSSSLTLK